MINELLAEQHPADIGVAVSGGGDSTALLHLLADWSGRSGCKAHVVTVDHGLRSGTKAEILGVAEQCAKLGLSHDVLHWRGWQGDGNLQDQARQARYGLIGDWARDRKISHVALGHTLDDQAETVLMRLARGSGVDGVSAILPARTWGGVRWLRPLLDFGREELRTYLRAENLIWAEDPSNTDARFDRVRMRAALDVLTPLGVTRQGLADTARRMASARRVLEQAAFDAAQNMAQVRGGAVMLEHAGLFALAAETRRRLLAHGLCWVASKPYLPRNTALAGLEAALRQKTTTTLHGCMISVDAGFCIIGREPAAVVGAIAEPGKIWDNRWQMHGPAKPGLTLRATGKDGLKQCPDWRATSLQQSMLVVAPAVWNGAELVAAPLAGLANGWRAELIHNENHFYTTILSH